MQQKTISKVSDYIQTIEQLRSFYPNGMLSNNPTNNHFLFRGLSNENYELIPGIYREDKKLLITNYTYPGLAKKDCFKSLFRKPVHM